MVVRQRIANNKIMTRVSNSETGVSNAGASRASGASARRRSGRLKRWSVVSVVVGVGIVGLVFWWSRADQAAALQASQQDSTIPVARGRVERVVESTGTVAANLEVEIKSRASGEVTQLPVDISQSVRKGDLLVQLDPTDEELDVRSAEVVVAQAQARLAQAKATLEQATLNLETSRKKTASDLESARVQAAHARARADRQKELLAHQLTSQEEYEAAESEAANALAALRAAEVAVEEIRQQEVALETRRQDVILAEADLRAAQIALDQQKKELQYTTVVAPIDGTVSSLDVQVGTIVASGINNVSGGTTLMTLADLSRIFVEAKVDEADIGGVRVGQRARVMVDSYPDLIFEGKVVRVAVKGVESSNVVTFEVKVEVTDERKGLLKPQMTANVSIIEAERDDVLMLPTAAIQRREGKAFVKLPSGELRAVELGVEGAEHVEIVSGLREGESVLANLIDQPSRWRNQRDSGPPHPPPH